MATQSSLSLMVAIRDREPWVATSTFTQLLSFLIKKKKKKEKKPPSFDVFIAPDYKGKIQMAVVSAHLNAESFWWRQCSIGYIVRHYSQTGASPPPPPPLFLRSRHRPVLLQRLTDNVTIVWGVNREWSLLVIWHWHKFSVGRGYCWLGM